MGRRRRVMLREADAMGQTGTADAERADAVVDRLFQFDDYRSFLREFFLEQKRVKPFFSHRYFARKAGFTSPSFLTHVIQGKRNLTLEAVEKLLKGMELKGKAASFLRTLVRFNQSKHPRERAQNLAELDKHRRGISARQLDKRQHGYFDAWYYPVIRELAVHAPWRGNYRVLGSLVQPPVGAARARRAVEALLAMGLLQPGPEGGFVQSSQAVLADQVPASVRRKFRGQMARRNREAMDRPDPGPRHFSGVTVAMSEAAIREMSALMDELRKRILERAVEDEKVERVCQFSFHAFPLSAPFPADPDAEART
jgi:uncharacterized protein (TIGR02147 family)